MKIPFLRPSHRERLALRNSLRHHVARHCWFSATCAASSVPMPRVSVAPDGGFTISTYESYGGAPESDTVLTARRCKPVEDLADFVGGPNVRPRPFAHPETSDIRIPVAACDSNDLVPIELK